MNDRVVISECSREDVPSIIQLVGKLNAALSHPAEGYSAGIGDRLEYMIATPEMYRISAARFESSIVGYLLLVVYQSTLHSTGTGLICELVVSEEHRGKGIGRALVEDVFRFAEDKDLDEIEVGTECENTNARGFYERMGFGDQFLLFSRELHRAEA